MTKLGAISLSSDHEELGHCPVCQREIAVLASWGELATSSEPWRIYWQGRALAGAQPMLVRILYVLLKKRKAPKHSLVMLLGEETNNKTLDVHMHRLRELLKAERIPYAIENIFGWGWELVEVE